MNLSDDPVALECQRCRRIQDRNAKSDAAPRRKSLLDGKLHEAIFCEELRMNKNRDETCSHNVAEESAVYNTTQ